MTEKLISIVIPARNEEKLIANCLESLQAQTYTGPVEIIIVDNNSKDATAAIAREYGVVVMTETQRGVCFARETGARAARGSIIVQTDADSTFPPDWLEQIATAFSTHPNAVGVAGSFQFGDGPWWGKYVPPLLFGITDIVQQTTGKLIYIPGSNTAFKKEAWHGYNTKFDQGGDESALLKQLKKEGEVVFLRHNTVLTSGRRLKKGVIYNTVVTFLFYRVFDYSARKFFGKKIAPRQREHKV